MFPLLKILFTEAAHDEDVFVVDRVRELYKMYTAIPLERIEEIVKVHGTRMMTQQNPQVSSADTRLFLTSLQSTPVELFNTTLALHRPVT